MLGRFIADRPAFFESSLLELPAKPLKQIVDIITGVVIIDMASAVLRFQVRPRLKAFSWPESF